jgi:hypothetical protein
MKFRALLLALLAVASCIGVVSTTSAGLVGIAGSRLTIGDAEQPQGDIFSDNFDYLVARDACSGLTCAAFTSAGWESGNFEEDDARGWIYTADPDDFGAPANPSGSPYALVQEFYPVSMRPSQTITAATSANPIVLTVANTALLTQEQYALEGMPGDFAVLNYINQNITVINGTTFSVPVNGSGFGAYTSGGTVVGTYNDIQPDPYLQVFNQSSSVGTIPPDVWFRMWLYVPETFTADIGSGPVSFDSTFGRNRDKTWYMSRETAPDPPYGASPCDGVSWIVYLGHVGVEESNARISVPGSFPTNEAFIDFDTGSIEDFGCGADDELTDEDVDHRLGHNLDNTAPDGKIVPNIWYELTVHVDTSGPYGALRTWLKRQGQTCVQIQHWVDGRHADAVALGGATADFTWDIADTDNQRNGHRQLRLNPVITGYSTDGGVGDHAMLIGSFDIASSAANLPTYDAVGACPISWNAPTLDESRLAMSAANDEFLRRAA